MPERLPLSALLSQALVAFTIELDNEFERRMPHTTTDFGGTPGAPWAVSLRMWSNFMRVVDDDGVTVGELRRRARADPQLDGMRRWGYVVIEPDPQDSRPRPPERDLVVRPTAAGKRARDAWRPLPDEIEQRWRTRLGAERVDRLRAGLEDLVRELPAGFPEWLSLYYAGVANPPVAVDDELPHRLPLSALLSQPLQAFALAYGRNSKLSLCYAANIVRLVGPAGIRVSDLPFRSGVAIPSIQTALGNMAKRGYVTVEPDPDSPRRKLVRLTDRGERAQRRYTGATAEIEERWRERFGAEEIDDVRASLEALVQAPAGGSSPLFDGLEPAPGSWRSKTRHRPEVLPDFPMPRQGGHPDGV
jgi:DNA-binding MarR family transcriptional regulator